MLQLVARTPISRERVSIFEKVNKTFYENKSLKIMEAVFDNALEYNAFSVCQKYLLKMSDMERTTKLFNEWATKGTSHEKDLFITRFILL